jgi:hypothetical protein
LSRGGNGVFGRISTKLGVEKDNDKFRGIEAGLIVGQASRSCLESEKTSTKRSTDDYEQSLCRCILTAWFTPIVSSAGGMVLAYGTQQE